MAQLSTSLPVKKYLFLSHKKSFWLSVIAISLTCTVQSKNPKNASWILTLSWVTRSNALCFAENERMWFIVLVFDWYETWITILWQVSFQASFHIAFLTRDTWMSKGIDHKIHFGQCQSPCSNKFWCFIHRDSFVIGVCDF